MVPKRITALTILLLALLSVVLASTVLAEEKFDVRMPPLDEKGIFWVYQDGKIVKNNEGKTIKMPPHGTPYVPFAWMPEQSAEMLEMDVEYKKNPYQGEMCILAKVNKWIMPNWLGVGFISGPDGNMEGGPWWCKTNAGWYYDLSGLKNKKFVVHMKSDKPGVKVQWKVGFLSAEKYGDSLKLPRQSRWLELSKEWKKFEINLSDLSKEELSRVCSICFVLSKDQQSVNPPFVFYIDSVYFE